VVVPPDGVVYTSVTGDGRWRVATDPDGVTIGTEVSVAGM